VSGPTQPEIDIVIVIAANQAALDSTLRSKAAASLARW